MPENLADADAWSAAIVDSSFDAIIGKRLDGTIISWNPAAEQMYGYTADEAIGRHISLIVPEDRRGELNDIMAGLARGEGTRGRQTVRVRNDGRRIDIWLTISPVRDGGGIIGGSAIAHDLSEMKRIQEELRRSREHLSIAMHAANIGVFRWEIEGDRLEWDETLRSICGLDEDRAVSSLQDFLPLIHPDDREVVTEEVRRCIEKRIEFEHEFRIVRPDGSIRWIADKARPFYDETGRPLYLTGACRDVTRRREAREALDTALEQKDLLLREINHRVKNSLQLASSLLQVQGMTANSEEVKRALVEAGGRLVTVARVHERLYQGLRVDAVELEAFLANLCSGIRDAVGIEGSEVSTEIEPVTLGADKAILVGLIVNELVTNALKHGAPDSGLCRVGVACGHTASGLTLSVTDTGKGLPAGFDLHKSQSFGMRILNSFAQQLGGSLQAESSPTGTRFVVEIPLTADETTR